MQNIRTDAELKLVGWMFWNKINPTSRIFSTEALNEQDKKNGYFSKPVYEIVE